MVRPDTTAPEDGLSLGEAVYDADGNEIGTVRGFGDDGVFVTAAEGMAALSIEHVRSGHDFGEAELLWRCLECGELDTLDTWPEEGCPSCGAAHESLYYFTED